MSSGSSGTGQELESTADPPVTACVDLFHCGMGYFFFLVFIFCIEVSASLLHMTFFSPQE